MTAATPKIIYIAGAGRSGSTVLSTLLGGHDNIFNAGELYKLVSRGWQGQQTCSCGAVIQDCTTWSSIKEKWPYDPADYLRLQQKFERTRFLLNPFKNKTDPDFQKYISATQGLFAAIADVTGASIIVDSSKSIARGWLLRQIKGADVSVIHLIRDGRSLAYSLSREDRHKRSALHAAAFWSLTNLLAALFLRGPRTLHLRYEDLCRAPAEKLTEIGALVSLPMEAVIAKISVSESFAAGHQVGGNRLRAEGPVILTYNKDWQTGLSPAKKAVFGLLAFPLLCYYGYLPQRGNKE